MKISKSTILIGISTIAVVGAGLAYYFLTKDDADVLGWKDSNWLYRKSISVANSGSTLTNEDVLIELDTATMISAGKLLTTCADLRFTDSDDTTYLQYWVEGGCNTATTQVWVRIPSLTAGGKTIYMYYGNNAATNAEQSWSGKFILMKNAACDTGWTAESNSGGAFYQRFPYPAATYGGTGGATGYSHTTLTMATATSSGTNSARSSNTGLAQAGAHTHNNVSFVIPSVTALPAYLDMIVCSNTKLIVKQNTVSFFTATVPAGFTQFSALNSKFPRGNSTYGGTSATTTHTHTVTAVTTSSLSATKTCVSGSTGTPSSTHTHTFAAFATGSGNQTPVNMMTIFGLASSDTKAPSGIIEMTNVVPPLGWTQYTGLNGYFPIGSATFGTTGGSATHTHSISSRTSGAYSGSVNCATTTPTASVPIAHTHTTSATTSGTASNIPPYINVMLIQKKTSQTVTKNAEELQNVAPNAPTSPWTEGATNPTGVGDTTPEFSAVFSDPDASDAGSYYQIQVNTNSSFTGTVMWDSTQTSLSPTVPNGSRSQDISYAGSTLAIGTTYYWRIKFWDNSNKGILESSWSATAQFTTNAQPTAPTDLYCQGTTNPTKVTTATPTLSAIFNDPDTADNGTAYRILVIKMSNNETVWYPTKTSLTTPVANGARSEDIVYAGIALVPGELYYWKIEFWDNYDNEGLLSAWGQFRMQGVNKPSLLLTNGSVSPDLVLTNPYFSAIYTDPNFDPASAYQIVVNTNSTFTGTTMWDSGKTAISLTSGNQSPNIQYNGTAFPRPKVTYYWRIKFWDIDDTESEWSDFAQFTYTTNSFMFDGLGISGINLN